MHTVWHVANRCNIRGEVAILPPPPPISYTAHYKLYRKWSAIVSQSPLPPPPHTHTQVWLTISGRMLWSIEEYFCIVISCTCTWLANNNCFNTYYCIEALVQRRWYFSCATWPLRWFLCLFALYYTINAKLSIVLYKVCGCGVLQSWEKLSLVSVKLLKPTDKVCSGTHCVPLKSPVTMRILPIATTLFMHCSWNIRNTRNQTVKGDCHTQNANTRLLSITTLVIHTHTIRMT